MNSSNNHWKPGDNNDLWYAKTNNEPTKPDHYKRNGIECIDAVRAMVGPWDGISGYNLGQAVAYIWRHKDKNGVEDLSKALTYIQWEIDRYLTDKEKPT